MGQAAAGGDGTSVAVRRTRTSTWWVVALVAVLALGAVATAVGTARLASPSHAVAALPGDPDVVLGYDDASAAQLGVTKHLRLTAKVSGSPIYPGAVRQLKVTIANPFGFAVRVVQVKAAARSTTVPGCRPAWFRSSAFSTKKLRKGVLVKAHRKAAKRLTITMVNKPRVNQDACKTARYTLALRAVARRA